MVKPGDVINSCVRILSRRAHSRHELRQKLFSKGFSHSEVEQALQYAAEHGYLDDADFARQVCAEALRAGHGRQWVLQRLRKCGLSQDLLQTALDTHFPGEDEKQHLLEWLERRGLLNKLADAPGALKEREKLYRRLRGRGFSAALLSEILTAKARNE